jgi:hypothetical protein
VKAPVVPASPLSAERDRPALAVPRPELHLPAARPVVGPAADLNARTVQ